MPFDFKFLNYLLHILHISKIHISLKERIQRKNKNCKIYRKKVAIIQNVFDFQMFINIAQKITY